MCLCARMLALEWKERAFIETVNSRWFFVDFRRPYLCTTTVHKYDVSIQSSTKVRETFRQITQKLSVGHKDRRLGKIVYILVFYNISFSWLLPLDAFQFISPTPYPFRRLLRRLFFFRRVYCVTVKPIYWIVSSSSFASNVFQKLLAKIHTSTKLFQDFLTFIFEALKLIISRLSIDDNKSTSWLTPFNYL